jgi:hypothetical protein
MMRKTPIKRLRRIRAAYGAEARSIGPTLSILHDARPALAHANLHRSLEKAIKLRCLP